MTEWSYVNDDVEQLWIRLACPNVKGNIIGCIYRPPKGNIANGISCISKTLDHICSYNVETILTGDFNINYNLRHTDSFKLQGARADL